MKKRFLYGVGVSLVFAMALTGCQESPVGALDEKANAAEEATKIVNRYSTEATPKIVNRYQTAAPDPKIVNRY